MQKEQYSGARSTTIDYIYVLSSCCAGWWQAWCFNYGRNSIVIPTLMSVPFALASYAYASSLATTVSATERPHWGRMLVLWAGMPVSLVVGALTIFGGTAAMYATGLGIVDLPFDDLRLLIGEGASCLVWAACLLVWARPPGLLLPRSRLFAIFAALLAGVLFSYGVSELILRTLHKDLFFLLTSVVATTISAMILVFLKRHARDVGSVENRGLGR